MATPRESMTAHGARLTHCAEGGLVNVPCLPKVCNTCGVTILCERVPRVRRNAATLVAVTHDHDLLDRFDRVIDFKDFYAHGQQGSVENIAGAV